MKFQKILTLVSLIFAALTIVYSFFFIGGMLYEIRFFAVDEYDLPGAKELKSFSQSANNTLVILAIVLLLCVVLLYITASNKRRNYYITNYIAIGITVVFSVVCSIVYIALIGKTFSLCDKVDMDAWRALLVGVNAKHFSTNKATLGLGIFVAILMLVLAAAWALNTVWKIKLMQGEKALLENNQVKEAA